MKSIGGALFVLILLFVGVSSMSCKKKSNPMGPGNGADEVIQIAGQLGSSSFVPSPDTILVNMKVSWHNSDGITHTATEVSGPAFFNTGNLNGNGDSNVITFSTPGTYNYRCNIHTSMTGQLVVLP